MEFALRLSKDLGDIINNHYRGANCEKLNGDIEVALVIPMDYEYSTKVEEENKKSAIKANADNKEELILILKQAVANMIEELWLTIESR